MNRKERRERRESRKEERGLDQANLRSSNLDFFQVSMAMINVNVIGDLPNLRTQFLDVFHRFFPLRSLLAAHKAASPAGESPAMVNNDEPFSHNQHGPLG